MTDQARSSDLAGDLLEGADAIADFLGWTPRRVYHVAEKKGLPIHKVPGVGLVARRSTLRATFESLDAPFLGAANAVDAPAGRA